MCEGGEVTLYASCFAAMTLHYLDTLASCGETENRKWASYINSWQDENTGLYLGPEIVSEELESRTHDYEHVTHHLTAHALPTLSLLGAGPMYELRFAHRFLDSNELVSWLERRNWKNAWLEGNNLLFIGQFLIHLRDIEKRKEAARSIRIYLEWLTAKMDPKTGLWGTDGYCSPFVAMCGGYHQLLVYYHEKEEIPYKERLVDTVLGLQHPDGGFHPRGGGGACEDVDAVDILVNMYKRSFYKRAKIRIALRKTLASVLQKWMPDGGFVYRLGEEFVHMGVRRTRSPANVSNLFATWFRIHTLALIGEVLSDHALSREQWKFNDRCSMGWHDPWDRQSHKIGSIDRMEEFVRGCASFSKSVLLKMIR